jgi:hypothetical protein
MDEEDKKCDMLIPPPLAVNPLGPEVKNEERVVKADVDTVLSRKNTLEGSRIISILLDCSNNL